MRSSLLKLLSNFKAPKFCFYSFIWCPILEPRICLADSVSASGLKHRASYKVLQKNHVCGKSTLLITKLLLWMGPQPEPSLSKLQYCQHFSVLWPPQPHTGLCFLPQSLLILIPLTFNFDVVNIPEFSSSALTIIFKLFVQLKIKNLITSYHQSQKYHDIGIKPRFHNILLIEPV